MAINPQARQRRPSVPASGRRCLPGQHPVGWPIVHQELHGAGNQSDQDADLPGKIVGAHQVEEVSAAPRTQERAGLMT